MAHSAYRVQDLTRVPLYHTVRLGRVTTHHYGSGRDPASFVDSARCTLFGVGGIRQILDCRL